MEWVSRKAAPELRPLASVPLAAMVQWCHSQKWDWKYRNTGSLTNQNLVLTNKNVDLTKKQCWFSKKNVDLNKKVADLANTFGAFDFDATTEGRVAGETFKFPGFPWPIGVMDSQLMAGYHSWWLPIFNMFNS